MNTLIHNWNRLLSVKTSVALGMNECSLKTQMLAGDGLFPPEFGDDAAKQEASLFRIRKKINKNLQLLIKIGKIES